MNPSGLVFQISTLIVVSGFINLIKAFIYPSDIWRRLLRWWKYRKFDDKVDNKFQKTLNKEFEHNEF